MLFLEDVRNVQARSRQEKLAAMGRVSAGIAHEIRNPLAAIAQANALLAEDATDPAQRQLMRMVTENVERLKRIVDDVMEVAPGAGAGRRRDRRDARRSPAVCSEWARAAGVDARRRTACCSVDLPAEPLGVRVRRRAPAPRARQPARQRAPPRQRARRARSSCACDSADDEARAVFSVAERRRADRRPTSSAYLFEPFFSTRSRGTGLGLYICRELCERYGARIDYRLLPRRGAAPQRVLRRHAARGAAGADRSPPAPHLMTTASHFSLLVVDDEPDLRTLYELTLLREGYDIETAGTVQDALLHLKDRTYSAVITDMRLPDGTGLDLLRWLEESGRREKAIVITAYGSAENAVEALKAGAYDYLTKPVDLKQFRARRRLGARPRRQRRADDRPDDACRRSSGAPPRAPRAARAPAPPRRPRR